MKDLIERLEKATGPSVEIDEAIRHAVGAEPVSLYPGEGMVTTDECYAPPAYTASLDAALTLVPEGAAWNITKRITLDCEAVVYGHDLHESGCADTPAIAICIAALKAREVGK